MRLQEYLELGERRNAALGEGMIEGFWVKAETEYSRPRQKSSVLFKGKVGLHEISGLIMGWTGPVFE